MDNTIIDYSRQQTMNSEVCREFTYHSSIHVVVGCGGIGYWIGLFLSMYGIKNIVLIDGDKIDKTNLPRIAFPPSWVGINKAVALRKVIHTLRPDCQVLTRAKYVEEHTMSLLDTLIKAAGYVTYPPTSKAYLWDCTDNATIQRLLSNFTSNNSDYAGLWKYTKVGYEGYHVGMFPELRSMWGYEDAEVGYQTTRANVLSSATAASLAILARMMNVNNDRLFKLDELVRTGTLEVTQ